MGSPGAPRKSRGASRGSTVHRASDAQGPLLPRRAPKARARRPSGGFSGPKGLYCSRRDPRDPKEPGPGPPGVPGPQLRPGGLWGARGPPWGHGPPGRRALRDPRAPRLGSTRIPGARRRGPLGPQASLGAIRVRRTPGPSGPQPWGLCRGARGHFKRAPRGPPGLEGGPPPPSRILPSTTPPVYQAERYFSMSSLINDARRSTKARKKTLGHWVALFEACPYPPPPPIWEASRTSKTHYARVGLYSCESLK